MLMIVTKSLIVLHTFVGVILIGIILLQRGRGGGLAGAFGGMGGQSAFGTKAGDVFTKITIYIASFWIVLGCICVIMASKAGKDVRFKGGAAANIKVAPADKADEKTDENELPAPANPPPGKAEKGDDVKDESALKEEGAAKDNGVKKEETPKTDDGEKKEGAPQEDAKSDAKSDAKANPEKPAESDKQPAPSKDTDEKKE